MPSRRTSPEIRMIPEFVVIAAHDETRCLCHHVHGAIHPVVDLFRMPDGELQIPSGMPSIRAGRRISLSKCIGHLPVAQRAGISAVACAKKSVVPCRGWWQPDFNVNF